MSPGPLLDRLKQARWTVLTALAAILAVGVLGGAPWLAVTIAMAATLAAAALAPRSAPRPDQAERRQAAGSLAGIRALDLAASVADPLVLFDRGGGIVHANPAALAAFGALAPGTSIRLKFRSPEMQELIDEMVEGGRLAAAIDYMERVPIERLFRVTATAIGQSSNVFVLSFKDQSEARRIDRMRADFIANASHELRTPLASVAGFIETLRGPARNDPRAREHFLEIMQSQTARMARLIDDLLSLSRLEMKALLRPGDRVDLAEVLRAVVDSLSHLARESGVLVNHDIPQRPIEVAGDRDELFQVFENLLENACKYGQSGGRVDVALHEQGEGPTREIVATVRDYGPGIPEEHIPRVTERFYRVDVETSRSQKGTGLGLSIVKHILTRHNARLTIRSESGKGAEFSVSFPPPAN